MSRTQPLLRTPTATILVQATTISCQVTTKASERSHLNKAARGSPLKPQLGAATPCSDPSKVFIVTSKHAPHCNPHISWASPLTFSPSSLCFSHPGFLATYFSNIPGSELPQSLRLCCSLCQECSHPQKAAWFSPSLGIFAQKLSLREAVPECHIPSLNVIPPLPSLSFLPFIIFLHSSSTVHTLHTLHICVACPSQIQGKERDDW